MKSNLFLFFKQKTTIGPNLTKSRFCIDIETGIHGIAFVTNFIDMVVQYAKSNI